MRKSLRICLFVVCLSCLSAVAQTNQPVSELDKLRSIYRKNLAYLGTEYSNKVTDLNQRYVAALDDLMKRMTQAGNLDGAMAVRAEKSLFEQTVPTSSQEQTTLLTEPQTAERKSGEIKRQVAPAGNDSPFIKDKGEFLDLIDGRKAPFMFWNEIRDNPSISVSRMGGCFTVKYKKTGFGGLSYKAKSTKETFNLNDWPSVSFDVRLKKQNAGDTLFVAVVFHPLQEGCVEKWNLAIPRYSISSEKWVRIIAPLSVLQEIRSMKNPQGAKLTTIGHIAVGVWSDIDVSDTVETDFRNVRLWKTPVDKVTVIPLEK